MGEDGADASLCPLRIHHYSEIITHERHVVKRKPAHSLALLVVLILLGGTLALPACASAKVFFYALTRDGDLVKYDPDAVKVEDLIQAVKNAQGMSSYSATVKDKKK